ncbi:MAG TPA: zf-TFIIB domain-containing protein [Candidatus Krumholzibacteria bacterium]
MDCPLCNVPMIVLEMDQVEVDHCQRCGGVWLDSEEMDLLLEGSEGREEIRRRATVEASSDEKKRRCPICSRKMEKARITRTGRETSILIDRCEKRHGTWLDGGELDALVKLSSFPEAHRIHDFLKAMFGGDVRRAGS